MTHACTADVSSTSSSWPALPPPPSPPLLAPPSMVPVTWAPAAGPAAAPSLGAPRHRRSTSFVSASAVSPSRKANLPVALA
eukprot:366165-Chlamydomonas_euryale.AAC.5